MLKVTNVHANKDYTLYVELSDGRSGIFDVKPYLERGVFRELKDQNYFKKVKPFFCGIAWPNEQDLSADTISHELKQAKTIMDGGENKVPASRSNTHTST